MSLSMPWQAYLLIGFIVVFVGGIALIFLIAFLEGWWLSRQSVPSRFEKLETETDFDESALPAIAEQLGMTQADQIPSRLSRAVLNAMPKHFKEAEFRDILVRKERDGVFLLCTVRRAAKVVVGDSSGESETKRYLEVDPVTVTAFYQNEGPYVPEFMTSPFLDYLIVKLVKLFGGKKWSGHPRFEDDPEFHKKLLIRAAEPEKVRPLLTERVRGVLKDNCDLTLSISGPVMIVYDDGHPVREMMRSGPEDGETVETCKVLAAKEWPEFYRAAESMIQSLKSAQERSL